MSRETQPTPILLLGSIGAGTSISGTWRGEPGAGPGALRRSVFPWKRRDVEPIPLPGRLTWPARRRWSAARARRSGGARSSSARRPGGTAGSGDLRGAASQERRDGHTDTRHAQDRQGKARWKPVKAACGGREQGSAPAQRREQDGRARNYAPQRPVNTGGIGLLVGPRELRCGNGPNSPHKGHSGPGQLV